MGYKSILTKIDELREIVSSWRDGEEPALLDKDMALERVKSIYEMLRFPVAEVEVEPEVAAVESVPEIEAELGAEAEAEAELELEAELEAEAEPSVSLDEDISLELVNITQLIDEALEDGGDMIDRETFVKEIEAVNQKKRERLNKILSLYDDDCDADAEMDAETDAEMDAEMDAETDAETEIKMDAEEKVEIEIETEIEPEADIESLTVEDETTPQPEQEQKVEPQPAIKITSLLSLNDRILLSQELFAGDDEKMIETLAILESQSTFDDAVIYIAERFMWSGDNEGAQLLMTLLQTRYQN
ncbi:MAG: hypothetical protein R3Y34_01605 [Rikenellaceae bacterium]